MDDQASKPKPKPTPTPTPTRRVRYKGTQPKSCKEKYKELQPDQYSEDVEKVIQQGRTPAGMHRSSSGIAKGRIIATTTTLQEIIKDALAFLPPNNLEVE